MTTIHRIRGIMAATYLIETTEALFLVDAGFRGHGRTILRAIRSIGRRPGELRLVVVTHGHLDHFGGLAELRDATNFEIGAHPAHADVIAEGATLVSPGRNAWTRAYVRLARLTMPHLRVRGAGPVVALEDGEPLHEQGLPGRIVHTPGHSDGCLSLLLDDGTAFVGDLVQGKRLPTRAPELPTMALDTQRAHASWRRLVEAGANRFMPAHAKPFTTEELLGTMLRDKVALPRLGSA